MLIWNSKKVIFEEDKLIINKRKKIVINYNEIEKCWYTYRTAKSIFSIILNRVGGILPGWLMINLSKSPKGFQKAYAIRLKPEEIERIPKALKNKIIFNKSSVLED